MKRLLAVLKAAWYLYRNPQPSDSEHVTTGYDFDLDPYLNELVREQKFQDAIEAVCQDNVERLTSYLRSCVRTQNNIEVALTEGAISVFEDLPQVLNTYATRYRVAREKIERQ